MLFFQDTAGFLADWSWQGIITGVVAFVIGLSALISSIKTIRNDGWEVFKGRWITPFKARREARLARDAKLDEVVNSCDTLGAKVSEVLREVKPNGGTSLRDEVRAMGEKVETTAAWIHHQKETSETPIFILDADWNMTFANCAFRELVNAEEADLDYRKYLSRIEAADQKRLIDTLRVAIENKIPFDIVVHFKIAGPHFSAIRLQASVNVGHGGVLKGFFGTASKANDADEIHNSQM